VDSITEIIYRVSDKEHGERVRLKAAAKRSEQVKKEGKKGVKDNSSSNNEDKGKSKDEEKVDQSLIEMNHLLDSIE